MPPDTPRSSLSTLEMGSKLTSRDLLDRILEFLRCPWRPGSSRRRSVDVRSEAVSGVDEEGGHSSRSLGASKLLRKVPSTTVVLTSSHVNRTLVLRIYLLSLPRKSEKSVKIGNRKPYENHIYGGHLGGSPGNTQVNILYREPLASVFPPQQGGGHEPWGQPPKVGPWLWLLVKLSMALAAREYSRERATQG